LYRDKSENIVMKDWFFECNLCNCIEKVSKL
jgi:hypothetical protein